MPLSATNHLPVHDSDLVKLLKGDGDKEVSKSNESDDDDSSMMSKQKR